MRLIEFPEQSVIYAKDQPKLLEVNTLKMNKSNMITRIAATLLFGAVIGRMIFGDE